MKPLLRGCRRKNIFCQNFFFITSLVFKLQKWFLHQNGVELNQKSKADDSGPLYKVTWRCLAVPDLPKALLKMASGLISPSGHHGQLCIVTESFLLKAPLTRKCVNVVDCYMPNILIAKVILFVLVPAVESSTPPIPRPIYSLRCWFQKLFANTPVGQCQEEQDSPPHDVLYHQHYWWS